MSLVRTILLFICLLISMPSFAGSTESVYNVKIKGISTHDGAAASSIYFILSDGSVAFIDSKNKELHSLALSAFMAGKTVAIHRYKQGINGSAETSFWLGDALGSGSKLAYKLHRLDVVSN